jgi:hypothetical protein
MRTKWTKRTRWSVSVYVRCSVGGVLIVPYPRKGTTDVAAVLRMLLQVLSDCLVSTLAYGVISRKPENGPSMLESSIQSLFISLRRRSIVALRNGWSATPEG